MKTTFKVIATFEILGGLSLIFSLFDDVILYASQGQMINLFLTTLLVIPSGILILGGFWLWKLEERGFLLTLISQGFQTVFIRTPFLSYFLLSPLYFLIEINSNGNVGTSLYLTTVYALRIGESIGYSNFGINIIAIILIFTLIRPYLLFKEYGQLPEKVKCKKCKSTLGWDLELGQNEIKCENCWEVNLVEDKQ